MIIYPYQKDCQNRQKPQNLIMKQCVGGENSIQMAAQKD